MARRPKPGSKHERDQLRTEMTDTGAHTSAIATEMRARFNDRPREAWRQAHGWTLQQAADRLNAHAAESGGNVAADASLLGKWEKWPAPSGRRPTLGTLSLLAALYGCALDDLLDLEDRRHLPDTDLRVLQQAARPPEPSPASTPEAPSARSGGVSPDAIRAAAGESAQWVLWAESSNVGAIALEQLWADVQALSADYLLQNPLSLFGRARMLRDRLFALLEGHQPPRQAADLYAAAGYVCALLAWMSSDLGQLAAAETQGRTAWLCAELAGHDGLRAWVCSTRSKIAFWDGRYKEAITHARRGATHPAPGTAAVLLACQEADAWAELGAHQEAQAALARAAQARDQERGADEIGGVLSCPPIRQANYAAAVHLRGDRAHEAITEAERALAAFQPHHYGTMAQLHIACASAHLASGEPEGLTEALQPVFALQPSQRLDPVTRRVRELGMTLARSRIASSRPALNAQEAIGHFCLESAPRVLALSPAGGTDDWISTHD